MTTPSRAEDLTTGVTADGEPGELKRRRRGGKGEGREEGRLEDRTEGSGRVA